MKGIDYIVIIIYVLGIVGAGMVFSGKMKNSKDMFVAGGQSQLLEFIQCIRPGEPEFGVKDDGAVAALSSVNQAGTTLREDWLQPSSSSKTRTFRAGTTVDMACL